MQDAWKQRKIGIVAMLLKAALAARGRVGLMLNVHESNLKAVEDVLPSLKSPTVAKLQAEGWFSVSTVVDQELVRDLIPRLKEFGAEDIVEYPLNKIVE